MEGPYGLPTVVGVLEDWSCGVLEYWRGGVMEYWSDRATVQVNLVEVAEL